MKTILAICGLLFLVGCAKDRVEISGLDIAAGLAAQAQAPDVVPGVELGGSVDTGIDRGSIKMRSPEACLLVCAGIIGDKADVTLCGHGVAGRATLEGCAPQYEQGERLFHFLFEKLQNGTGS